MKHLFTVFCIVCVLFSISPAQTKGDVNNDGMVNEMDIELVQKIISGDYETSPEEMAAADVDSDGDVDEADLGAVVDTFFAETEFAVITPNNGENWSIGDEHTIVWNRSTVSAAKVSVELSTDAGTTWSTVMDSTENDGSVRWKPTTADMSDNCLLRISSIHEFSVADQSDAVFSVVPNATEIKGDINFNGVIDEVDVNLIRDISLGVFVPTTVELWIADVNSDGKVTVNDSKDIYDWFIYDTWKPTITIVAPQKDGSWRAGDNQTLVWTSELISASSEFVVELSSKNGQTWTTIFDSTKNDGNESWTPSVENISNHCFLRVSTNHGGFVGTSDKFKILPITTPVIRPESSESTYSPGDEICVEIQVGRQAAPVYNLSSISFEVRYMKNYVTLTNSNPGDIFGDDVITFFNHDERNGKFSAGLNRTPGTTEFEKYGCALQLYFSIDGNVPTGSDICFYLDEISASDSYGSNIDLDSEDYCVTINDCVETWPGDTNMDGIVDECDVLPIGLYWELDGYASECRQAALENWGSCCCKPWGTRNATCADVNGDGVVNGQDLLPLARFWQNSHTVSQGPTFTTGSDSIGGYVLQGMNTPDSIYEAVIYLHRAVDLLGASFKCTILPLNQFKILNVEKASFLGDDIILFYKISENKETVAVSTTRKYHQGGVNGTGHIVKIKFENLNGTPIENITLSFTDKTAMTSTGEMKYLEETSAIDRKISTTQITEFALLQNYPNPFNPSTHINYLLPSNEHVCLVIVNALGQKVVTLVDEERGAGTHTILWDGTNELGEQVSSGVYMVRMKAGDFTQTRKMLFMR